MAAPRAPLARHFGVALLARLDQTLGPLPEPIAPVMPPGTVQPHLTFPHPLLTPEALVQAIRMLADTARRLLRAEPEHRRWPLRQMQPVRAD